VLPLVLATRAEARDPSREPPLAPLGPPQAHDDVRAASPIQLERMEDWAPKFPRAEIALQTGLSLPYGTALSGIAMGEVYNFQVPVWFEAGARLVPWLLVSGYASFALGGPAGEKKARCAQANNDACVATTARFGVAARVRLRTGERWMPWFGYGFGYEWTASDFVSAAGLDYGHLSAGLDLRAAKDGTLGVFVDFSLAKYEGATDTPPNGQPPPCDLIAGNKDPQFKCDAHESGPLHGWFFIGLRGAWTL